MIERILKLLSDSGITAKKLTEDINISSSAISEWKKGKGKPSAEAIIKIAEYFNVSTDYILLGKNINEIDNKILNLFHQLNEDNQDIIIGKIKELIKEQKSEKSITPDSKLK